MNFQNCQGIESHHHEEQMRLASDPVRRDFALLLTAFCGRVSAMPNDQNPGTSPDPSQLQFRDGFTVRDEANAIVAYAFRNGPIENLHAGKNSELLENKELRRITGEEMKTIMIYACETVEKLLRLRQSDPLEYVSLIQKYNHDYCRHWNR